MTVVSLRPSYVWIRTAAWWALWFIVHLDAYLHRKSRGRGWRLHLGILAFLTTEVAFQTIHLFVALQYSNSDDFSLAESNAFKAEVFFGWLAESVFLCLILLVSIGYCILRDRLGENLRIVIATPIVYGVTSMTFDYILLSTANEQVITQQSSDDEAEAELKSHESKVLALVTCMLVKAVVFVCAWIFVFEHLNAEVRLLKGENEDIVVPQIEDHGRGEYNRPEMQDETGDDDPEEGANEPKTMADAIGDQAKLLVLTRFRNLLLFYVFSVILVNILPLYIGNSSVEKIQSVSTVCANVLRIGFITALAIIFRPVGDNPYLLLADDFDDNGDGKEVTTELGIISFEPSTPQQTIVAQPEARDSPEQPQFSLADEENIAVVSHVGEQAEKSLTDAPFTPKLEPTRPVDDDSEQT